MATAIPPLTDSSLTESSGERAALRDALGDDPRLELVERIIHTPAFQKAVKLQALLRFIVDQSLREGAEEITEQRIGNVVFGKGPEYSPLLDSSVRVQARQLRLKLHEYFDGVGRGETMVLEIPKGSYRPVFRSAILASETPLLEPVLVQTEAPVELPQSVTEVSAPSSRSWLVAMLAVLAILLLLGAAMRFYRSAASANAPWPLGLVVNHDEVTHVILADSAYQITSTANGRSIDLNEYLRTKPRNNAAIDPNQTADVRLSHALAGGTFTSFADVIMVNSLATVAGRYKLNLDIKSARDLDPRDLEEGNFIFAGSPSSNPWVSLYNSKLNFREDDDLTRPGMKMFVNTHPQSGEPKAFTGNSSEDAIRVDYADLAVVPGLGEHGTVMIVQGLRHEATEAVARMLADPDGTRMIRDALSAAGDKEQPAYFEAMLSVRAVAGIPRVTGVAAIRAPHK